MYLIILNNKTQFAISYGDSELRNFFQKYKTKSTSAQATGNRRAGGPIVHKQIYRVGGP